MEIIGTILQRGNTLMSLVIVFIPVPQFPAGFSVATSVRVGNALGAGSTEQAKLSSKVSLICTGLSQISEPGRCLKPFFSRPLS